MRASRANFRAGSSNGSPWRAPWSWSLRILLFDEPLSNLDAKLRRRVRQEIRDLQQRLGMTSVYVTHDQEEALAVSDRIIVMKNAGIAQEGSPRDLYESPADVFVADFIGDANLIAGEVVGVEGGTALVRLGSLELALPARGAGLGPGQVAIRPEALRLSTSEADGGRGELGGPGRLEGTVRKATYLGSHLEYIVECELGELFVVDPRVDRPVAAGARVAIALADHGITLVRG